HGDEERGLVGLGHTLHLVHDLTVPPHTRNDPHPPAFDFGSPYEEWTSKFTPNNTDIISELSNRGPILLGKIEDYFDSVARYTNANFFSKDTILSGEYYTPVYSIVGVGMLSSGEMQSFGLAKIENQSYKLFELRENESFSGENIKLYLINDKKKEPVLSDYWNMLSKQAVLNGAGVIKLFFDEVEKEKETLALYYKNQSWLGKLLPKMFEPKYTKGDISPRQNLAAVSEIFKDSETDELEEEIVLEEDVDDKENNKLRLAEEIIIPVTQLQGMSPPLSSTPDLGGAIIEEHCVPPDPNCVPGFET
ncbi:hypothetical protein HQ403_01500, partial [Candidatus Kaiserbacteria bacterium]|nr:hypothetical protein [Candidatus Kaiserbacteria bacterium]